MLLTEHDRKKDDESIHDMLLRRNREYKEMYKGFFKEHDTLEAADNSGASDLDVFG
jgi:hypothetical protein